MEGAIDLNRCYGPTLRQAGRVRCWCWKASLWLDICVFIATNFEPYQFLWLSEKWEVPQAALQETHVRLADSEQSRTQTLNPINTGCFFYTGPPQKS